MAKPLFYIRISKSIKEGTPNNFLTFMMNVDVYWRANIDL